MGWHVPDVFECEACHDTAARDSRGRVSSVRTIRGNVGDASPFHGLRLKKAGVYGLGAIIPTVDTRRDRIYAGRKMLPMAVVQRGVQFALILCVLASILTLMSIFYEGLSATALLAPLSGIACCICLFWNLPQLKLVRATFAIESDDIEDRLAQAMAMIGFTTEPNSQIGHSFTFRARGVRLVATKTASGIEVAGPSGWVDLLAKKLEIKPIKSA